MFKRAVSLTASQTLSKCCHHSLYGDLNLDEAWILYLYSCSSRCFFGKPEPFPFTLMHDQSKVHRVRYTRIQMKLPMMFLVENHILHPKMLSFTYLSDISKLGTIHRLAMPMQSTIRLPKLPQRALLSALLTSCIGNYFSDATISRSDHEGSDQSSLQTVRQDARLSNCMRLPLHVNHVSRPHPVDGIQGQNCLFQ